MSKLKPEDRKGIVIKSDDQLRPYGGMRGPITTKFYESVDNIRLMVEDKVAVTEVTPAGKEIKLTPENFDSKLDGVNESLESEDSDVSVSKLSAQPADAEAKVTSQQAKTTK